MALDPWACVLLAALLLTLPLPWLLAAALAAAVHELCHALCALALGGRVGRLTVRPAGMGLECWLPGPGRELLCALAGPLGSGALAALFPVLPRTALCALVQGLFNLLPVYPLDGGRAVRCALALLCPRQGTRIARWIERAALAAVLALGLAGAFRLGAWTLLPALALASTARARKTSCKPRHFGVQ